MHPLRRALEEAQRNLETAKAFQRQEQARSDELHARFRVEGRPIKLKTNYHDLRDPRMFRYDERIREARSHVRAATAEVKKAELVLERAQRHWDDHDNPRHAGRRADAIAEEWEEWGCQGTRLYHALDQDMTDLEYHLNDFSPGLAELKVEMDAIRLAFEALRQPLASLILSTGKIRDIVNPANS